MQLWDRYNGLLTPTQQDITNLYFNLDLTVSEIAEERGISRQAVSDCLAGCKKQLEELEEKLHLLDVTRRLNEAGVWAESLKKLHPEFSGEIEILINILNK